MIEETNKIIEKLDKTEDIVRMKELKDKLNSNKEYLNLMSEFEKNKKLYIENNTLDDEIMTLRKKLFNIDELKEALIHLDENQAIYASNATKLYESINNGDILKRN